MAGTSLIAIKGGNAMVTDVTERISEQLIGRRVWGEPIAKDDVIVIPAATVRGGGGGGEGEQPAPTGEATAEKGAPGTGRGSGFGLAARPVGAMVIREGQVSWRPAVNVNHVVLGGQVVAVVALLVLRSLIKERARAAAHQHPGER